ncbi:glucose 1-dehydrogenase [Xylariaceae sp. FL0804]|nr:glucose 1-dehydrogenase [Xylariaceae sp. FL0804]
MAKRVFVCYCVDVDACSIWMNTRDGSTPNASNVSRGIFGANAGLDRLLKFFGRHDVKATFFTPSHSIVSFPDQLAKVRDAGHEIGLHGYMHENHSMLSEDQQRKVTAKSIEVHRAFTGKRPRGWAAPYWDVSPVSMRILEELGVDYDHSLMHHDCLPYWAADAGADAVHTDYARDPDEWMVPMRRHTPTRVVEIPANWDVDDWPPLNAMPGRAGSHGFVNPRDVQQVWEDQFDFLYGEHDTFVFCISIHPQVSGKAKTMPMHERFIEFLKRHEGVEFVPAEFICDEFKAGRIPEARLEMGV